MKSLALLLALAPAAAVPQEDAAHPRELDIPSLAPYSPAAPARFEFEGGPTLLVVQEDHLPLIDGLALIKVGSVHDPEGKTGLVELLVEALRAGGSKSLPGPELDRWLEAHGALLEFQVEPEFVRVEFSCLSEHTAELISLVKELLREPLLPDTSLQSARTLMRSAFERERDDTNSLANRMLLRAAYGPGSAYARTRQAEELESITREDLLAFHRDQFGAERMVLGVSGDVEPEELSELVRSAFADWKAASESKPLSAPAFLQPRSPIVHIIDRPGVTQTELRLTAPGIRRLHPDYSALSIWSHAIGAGGAANRMMVRIRTELGLAYTVGAYYRAGWRTAGRFEAWCGTRNESVSEALAAMLEVLRAGTAPLETEELEAVRSRVLNGRVFEVDSSREVLERNLLLEFYSYPEGFRSTVEDKLRSLTADEIAAAVARHLDLERLIIIAVGPAEQIEASLAPFGEVIQLDDRGEPRLAAAPARLEQLFTAMGGRRRWAELETLHRKGVVHIPASSGPIAVPRENWMALNSNRSRTEVEVNGTKATIVLTADSCFSLSANNIEDLPADQCAQRRARADGNLYKLLRLLAKDQAKSVTQDEAGSLLVTLDSGLTCTLQLNKDGKPISLRTVHEGSEEFWEYLEWSETEGTPWFTKARERNLGSEVTNTLFDANCKIDEALFRDPRHE